MTTAPGAASGGDPAAALTATLAAALAAGTREAFTLLLRDDVRWGGERRGAGHECTTREQAGEHYAGLLAAGVTLRIADLRPADPDSGDTAGDTAGDVFTARMQVGAPDPDDYPPEMAVRLTVRDGLIAEICILDTPADLDALPDDPVHEAAVTAVHGGDLSTLQQLLADHPDLASTRLAGRGGRTLLHVATDWPGHHPSVAATIAALVAAGADPDTGCLGEHPETPLHWAASADDVDAIDALLDAGADIDAPGAVIAGGTPMADATAFGQWNAARRLLERGATTTLFEAAALGLVADVEHHLATGGPTAETITSSFWGACHGGHIATAAVLLDAGADINWVGYDDLTPLDAAQRSDQTEVVAWLEQHGAFSATSPTP